MPNNTSANKRRVVKAKHPWKQYGAGYLKSHKDDHYSYLKEGLLERIHKAMRKNGTNLLNAVNF